MVQREIEPFQQNLWVDFGSQSFTARFTQFFDVQLGISLSRHGDHMLLQTGFGSSSLAGPRRVPKSFAIEAVQLTNSQQPCQSPVFQFRIALADSHKVTPHVSPAEREQQLAQLDLPYRLVRTVAINDQYSRDGFAEV